MVSAASCLTATQAVCYVRAVVFPALVGGCAEQRTLDRLQSMCERIVRNRAWLPHGICCEAIRVPSEFGGLDLGMLPAELDGRLLHIVRATIQQPRSLAARLLLQRLEHWRNKYALSAQPLDQLSFLPFDIAQCGISQRSVVHAVMCAMQRVGCRNEDCRCTVPFAPGAMPPCRRRFCWHAAVHAAVSRRVQGPPPSSAYSRWSRWRRLMVHRSFPIRALA